MDFFSTGLVSAIDKAGVVVVLALIAIAVITDKLVWHTRLKNAESRADRWEEIALAALSGPAQAGVRAAEVAVGVVSSIPDPQGDRDRAAQEASP